MQVGSATLTELVGPLLFQQRSYRRPLRSILMRAALDSLSTRRRGRRREQQKSTLCDQRFRLT